jgi:large subunit ribosomal protein L10
MNRSEKKNYVENVGAGLKKSASVVVVHYQGLTVAEVTALRGKMRAAGGSFQVTKNTLTKLALKETEYESLAQYLTGPTAIGYSSDPVAPAKVLVEFAKGNEKLKILGGAFGAQKLDVKGVETLAKMPSLDELRATLIGMISTPATRIAGILQAPAGQLARVCGAYGAKS